MPDAATRLLAGRGKLWSVLGVACFGCYANRQLMIASLSPGLCFCAQVRELGVVLAHSLDALEWRGKLLSEIAVALAKAGRAELNEFGCAKQRLCGRNYVQCSEKGLSWEPVLISAFLAAVTGFLIATLCSWPCSDLLPGYLVVRYNCNGKEQYRQTVLSKTLDAAATSPYARRVNRWVLAGVGHGARTAASIANCVKGVIAGLVLISYPLVVSGLV